MDMTELQHVWRDALAPATLACIIQETPTNFTPKGNWVLGSCDTVRWDQMHATAEALMRLAAQVLERNENEFEMRAGYLMEGDPLHGRYGIHIELPGSDAASRSIFQQAVGPFARGILESADGRSMDLFPTSELAESLREKVMAQIADTLRRLNGRKIKMPVAVLADGMIVGLAGRYAEAPPPDIDRTPFEVIGRVEGVGRPERKFTVLVPGVRERLQRVNFDLDRFLEAFKAMLCDGRVYRFTIHMELDAKSRPMAVVDSVAPFDGASFALTG